MSPEKKKRRKFLTKAEALEIIRGHNRNLRAAADTIALDYFMKIPLDQLPEKEMKEMEATIGKITAKLGEFVWREICFIKLECINCCQYCFFHLFMQSSALIMIEVSIIQGVC